MLGIVLEILSVQKFKQNNHLNILGIPRSRIRFKTRTSSLGRLVQAKSLRRKSHKHKLIVPLSWSLQVKSSRTAKRQLMRMKIWWMSTRSKPKGGIEL